MPHTSACFSPCRCNDPSFEQLCLAPEPHQLSHHRLPQLFPYTQAPSNRLHGICRYLLLQSQRQGKATQAIPRWEDRQGTSKTAAPGKVGCSNRFAFKQAQPVSTNTPGAKTASSAHVVLPQNLNPLPTHMSKYHYANTKTIQNGGQQVAE